DRSGANALKLSALENGTESGYLAIDRTSGKIGIGTTSPVGQLQIGQSNMTGSPGAPIESRRLSIGTHTHTGATFDIFQRDMTDHAYLDFRYAGTTPIMTFKGSGQVSFGTQSVSSHLLVSSNSPNAYTSLGFENTAAGGNKWNFLAGATGSPLGANRMCLETGGVCRLNVDTTGNLNIGGTLTQSSDRRLKTEIEIIPDSLDKLLTLNGVTYFWKDSKNGTDKQMGLIAQEVEKVFPEAIKKDNLGMLSVAYQNLVGPIINSIKEIYSDYLVPLIKNDKAQDRKIASLEVENKKLKEENALFKEYLCQKDPKANFCQEKKSKSSKP
ncbi:MAG: tail fiber domain-containing protein, partial [Bacteriovoracaceae bacterium]|nr:tail fiber domain-containing protein [Bacteriovoracaceae bacterium]